MNGEQSQAESPSGTATSAVDAERARRLDLWHRLLGAGGPQGVPPGLLRDLGIYGGAQGIWVDKERTGHLGGGPGVTVGVLHTGRSYADDLADDCIIYHYPATRRPPGRDRAEVEATEAASRLGLPLFVIAHPSAGAATRDVRLAWVESWDDATRTFLMSFGERPPASDAAPADEDAPFLLAERRHRVRREATARPGQQRFKFRVLRRYSPCCVV